MEAGCPISGNGNGRRMRASAAKQLRQKMGMGTVGAVAVSWGNRLIDFRSTDARYEYAMRACLEYGRGCGIVHVENRPPFSRAKG
jgi:hypothetical protein